MKTHEFVFDGKPRKIQLCRVCGRSKRNGNHITKALVPVAPGGPETFELQAQTRVYNITCAVTGEFSSAAARTRFLERMAEIGFRVISAILLCVLLAAPAAAEPTPLKWSVQRRPIADSISNLVVAANLGADTIHSWRSADRRAAFTCQAIRIGSTVAVAEITKRLIHRPRPDRSDNKSFYSMHEALAMQASGWRVQAGIPIAIGAGYLRMAAGKHFATDVAVGAAAGFLASQFFGGTECVP